MMPTVDEIIEALPRLSPDEVKRIRDHSGFLTRDGSTQVQDKHGTEDQREVYRALSWELHRLGYSALPPLGIVLGMAFGHKIVKQSPRLRAFADRCVPGGSRSDRSALYRTFMLVLTRSVAQQNLPVSLKTLVDQLDRVPGLVSRAFPGYIESGLGRFLVKRHRE